MAYERFPKTSQRQTPAPSLDQVWPRYLDGGYFDDEGHIRPELLERRTMERLARAMGDAQLNAHQLRRFYNHCRQIQMRLAAGRTWTEVRSDFLKLDIAAADALGKDDAKIPRIFHDFIRRNVATVRSESDFLKGFLPHFEALVGFASGKLRRGGPR